MDPAAADLEDLAGLEIEGAIGFGDDVNARHAIHLSAKLTEDVVGIINEGMEVVSAASYESLALGLTFGINWALFVQPVTKYANEEIKKPIFKSFIDDHKFGGLMITEPDYGSDALSMQTSFTEELDHYHLKGTKHWAGLTGWADYWLLTARKKSANADLMRDIDFFYL